MLRNHHAAARASELLDRATAPLAPSARARTLIEGARVLVTGAGGSIGSEIVRQCHQLDAGSVVCLDNNEYGLYLLERELKGAALLDDDAFVLADIRDHSSVNAAIRRHRPQVVFHAAAVKHLPLLERAPESAVLTNVLGTLNVARACALHGGVRRLVNVSTDKAANPTSVLGMSKRLAEVVAKQHASRALRVASVRFGNVFASRGSFVETLEWQVANRRPVTLTDPTMTRYFMTIPEAVGLVIEAAEMANGGDTFVLDMGSPCRIVDLVDRLAERAGTRPEVVVLGARRGEKLAEELFDEREERYPTRQARISGARVGEDGASLLEIRAVCERARRGVAREWLRARLAELTAPAPVELEAAA